MSPKPMLKQPTTSQGDTASNIEGKRQRRPTKKVIEATAQVAPVPKRGRGRPKNKKALSGTNTSVCADNAKASVGIGSTELEVRAVDKVMHLGKEVKNGNVGQYKRPGVSVHVAEQVAITTDDGSDGSCEDENSNKGAQPPKTAALVQISCGPEANSLERNVTPPSGQALVPTNLDDLDVEEPSDDILMRTLADGIANGTILLSDSDSEDLEDTSDPLHPPTSICDKIGHVTLRVKIHDGLAERFTTISSSDHYLDVLEKTAQAMKRPNHAIEIGYEASWSTKIGTKKSLTYISNKVELDEFWLAYSRYMKDQRSKPRNRGQEVVCEVVFRNTLDNAQNRAKTASYATDASRGRPPKHTDPTFTAKGSVKDKLSDAAKRIQAGMFCQVHNRLCYVKFDGTCGVYTPEYVLDHARKLAAGEPHVVANKVPDSMSSKVLDYRRPCRAQKASQKESPFADMGLLVDANEMEVSALTRPMQVRVAQAPQTQLLYKGPLNYPAITDWLKACDDDFERGRDKHEYTALSLVFATNGCTRIDDIARMSPETIKGLAEAQGITVTVGLVNRVHAYAVEDVARVKREGKLSL